MSEGWQERVIAERISLEDKVIKIRKFIAIPDYEAPSTVDAALLEAQEYHMSEYLTILYRRTDGFNRKGARQ